MLSQIITLTKKFRKKIVAVFIIAFPKLPQKCVKVPKTIVKCQKYRLGPPAPEGGLKYYIYKKRGQIMTLNKKLCKKSGLVFIIQFHKLPQKCLSIFCVPFKLLTQIVKLSFMCYFSPLYQTL